MDTLEAIKTRRSVRRFKDQDIPDELIDKIITAGTWAPSGINNQPWRFAVIRDKELKSAIAKLTKYENTLRNAPVIVPVFLDRKASYDYVKDVQAVGACLQNMLLAIHALGLGGVWIGEILKNKEEARKLCGAPDEYELMAVIALGFPAEKTGKGDRYGIGKVVFLRR